MRRWNVKKGDVWSHVSMIIEEDKLLSVIKWSSDRYFFMDVMNLIEMTDFHLHAHLRVIEDGV